MPAGLIQVMTTSREDVYFTSMSDQPGQSIWKGVIRKKPNFAIEPIRMWCKSDPRLGQTFSVTIDNLGDVLAGVFVELTLTKKAGDYTAAYHPVEALFEEITLLVDGQIVETHTSDWLRLYNTLHLPYDKSQQYTRMSNYDPEVISSGQPATQTFWYPLTFSFCRHPGCALPLIALRHSEVVLTFKLAAGSDVGVEDDFDLKVFGDFAYLGEHERMMLVSKPYDLLLEQVSTQVFSLPAQVPSDLNTSMFQAKLNLFHPVKSLYWFVRGEYRTNHGRYVGDRQSVPLAYTLDVASPGGLCLVCPIPDSVMPIYETRLLFDGQERVRAMKSQYFNRFLPFKHCIGQPVPGVCMFSFGKDLEDFGPQGVCNFSNMREARLDITFKKNVESNEPITPTSAKDIAWLRKLVVIAWGFNILRIENGKGVVAFT
jgi:hypothetical protein